MVTTTFPRKKVCTKPAAIQGAALLCTEALMVTVDADLACVESQYWAKHQLASSRREFRSVESDADAALLSRR